MEWETSVRLWMALLVFLAVARPALGQGPLQKIGLPDPQPGDVVLLKRTGIVAYEEAAEGFAENCRVRFRPINIQVGETQLALGDAQRRVGAAHLVVAVGQAAVDVAAGTPAQIVYAMALDPPGSALGADYEAPVETLFRALLLVRPNAKTIGVVSGRRGMQRLVRARQAARALGLHLLERSAEDGAQMVRALRDLSGASQQGVDALWIGADPQLLTTPVFQYVLQLQLRTGLPVLAATRQQVRSGAFLAVDWNPRMVGRRLAALVNQTLDGVVRPDLSGRDDPAGLPQVTMNRLLASKLGVDIEGRRAAGWRVE